MDHKQIEAIVKHLPEDEREEARYRILRAHFDGVTDIDLWTGDEDADITDLVGNCSRRREELRAKGDEWSSGLIGLAKYASSQNEA